MEGAAPPGVLPAWPAETGSQAPPLPRPAPRSLALKGQVAKHPAQWPRRTLSAGLPLAGAL